MDFDPGSRRSIPRSQQGRDEISRVGIEDQQGVVDMLSVKSVIEAQLLLSVSGIGRAVHVQRNLFLLALFSTFPDKSRKTIPRSETDLCDSPSFPVGTGWTGRPSRDRPSPDYS